MQSRERDARAEEWAHLVDFLPGDDAIPVGTQVHSEGDQSVSASGKLARPLQSG